MKYQPVAMCALAAMVALAPVSASAHDRDHWGHGGPLVGLIALGAAVVVGTAAILTAPVRVIAAPREDAYYGPPPGYYNAPPPGYYARQAPAYYEQPRVVYYDAPQEYYAPRRGYYYR